MSQIFEALRRTRDADRSAAPKRSVDADTVLASMGIKSERRKGARERVVPIVLIVLLAAIAWLGWRWYVETARQRIVQVQPPASRVIKPVSDTIAGYV